MHSHQFSTITALVLSTALFAVAQGTSAPDQQTLPRTAGGMPDLQGIWQASSTAAADLQDHAASLNMLAGRSVVAGSEIPYQPWAASKKAENFQNRQTADPLSKCYMPGVPRIMYLDFPFQIFQTQTAIVMAFEWELDYRLIHTDGTPHPTDADFWMGDSRGHWEGDTLVVDVSNINDKTWFDMAGDFHSDALHVVERYHMSDHDTIQYEATMEDSKVFTKPWTINIALRRRLDRDRLFEYSCQSEVEEANGAFTREERTWFPGSGMAPQMEMAASPHVPPAPAPAAGGRHLRRTPDGQRKPDLQGFYESGARGANQGLERLARSDPGALRAGQSMVVDPPDGKLPMQPWAVEERTSRDLTERGYDDPTAHCFPAGARLAIDVYPARGCNSFRRGPTTSSFCSNAWQWRIVPLDGRPHLPDSMRLWQGDSVGHWEGDTLVVDTANLNGKTWLGEGGEIASSAEHVVERFTPAGPGYRQLRGDRHRSSVVYTRPWTIAFSDEARNVRNPRSRVS